MFINNSHQSIFKFVLFTLLALTLNLISAIALANPSFLMKWGELGAAAGEFNEPHGIAVDSAGNVYVTDKFNHRVQKFDNGTFITEWGTFGTENGQFHNPAGIAVDSANNVYVVDKFNHRIQKFDSRGTFLTKWGTNGTEMGQFQLPEAVAIDSHGNVYVTDSLNQRIQKFDSTGIFFITQWGTQGSEDGQFFLPKGIAVDSADNIYVADAVNHRIQKFDSNGTFLIKWGTNGSENGQLTYPKGVAVDRLDNVYVTDRNRIQKFENGRFLVQWEMAGSEDGQLSQPYGITVNSTDEIYVVDRNNHHIQKFGITVSPVPSANGISGSGISISCSNAITTLNRTCNAGGKTMTALKEIGEKGQLSNAIIDTSVINHGWISNVTITSEGTVSGGIATGYIKVEGSLENFEFRGAVINGRNDAGEIVGLLGGTLFNNSKVGGYFQDVLLAKNTYIYNGYLKGEIIGDADAPALLENITVKDGSMLDNVIIGRDVKLGKTVYLGAGVQFFIQAAGMDEFGNSVDNQTYFLGEIRTQTGRHPNDVKVFSPVKIRSQLFVDPEHLGQSAALLMVGYHQSVTHQTIAYMRVGDHWRIWDGELSHLEPALQYDSLPEEMKVIIFEGDLTGGKFTIFVGYRLDNQTLIFNGNSPIKLEN